MDRVRHPASPSLGIPDRAERIVAREELVRAISAERDRDLATCMMAEQIGRQQRRVGNGLVPACGNVRQQIQCTLYGERLDLMTSTNVSGYQPRKAGFVKRRFFEADREGRSEEH